MSKRSKLSPLAVVMIERVPETPTAADGFKTELITEYSGSALKGGRAFAKAIEKAKADQNARRVIYHEIEMAEIVVDTSVPIVHEESVEEAEDIDGSPF